jgi:predicted DNA-binding transcriptional regulator AlpA
MPATTTPVSVTILGSVHVSTRKIGGHDPPRPSSRQQDDFASRLLGIRRVVEISGFSKATILRKIKAGTFPRAVIAEGNCTRWDLAEVMQWRSEQFRKRDERLKHSTEAQTA